MPSFFRRRPVERILSCRFQPAASSVRRLTGLQQLESRLSLDGRLLITEAMASNDSALLDSDGNASDWIEIHNPSTEPVNLLGWSLSDEADQPDKWRFPYAVLDPGGYLVAFASRKDRSFDTFRLVRDFHGTPDGTFLVDLPAGTYDVRLTLGDTDRVRDFVVVSVQGAEVDRITTAAGEFVSRNYTADVTTETGSQLAVRLLDEGGETGRAAVTSLMIRRSGGDFEWKYDFGTPDSPLEPGFTRVTQNSQYSPLTGFGWQPGTVVAHQDRPLEFDQFHTNFQLSAAGEQVVLADPTGRVVSALPAGGGEYPPQFADISYGILRETWPLLDDDVGFRYRVPTSADAGLATNWTDVDFDDSAWNEAAAAGLSAGAGFFSGAIHTFSDLITTRLESGVSGNPTSVWFRQSLSVEDLESIEGLALQMQFDDGFAAYLNGVLIAQANAPLPLAFDSAATVTHFNREPLDYQVPLPRSLLRTGTNILALHALNRSSSDQDLLVRPQLLAAGPIGDGAELGYLARPTPGGLNTAARSPDVRFSRPAGTFQEPFELVLTADLAEAAIFYTTDGSQPTPLSNPYSHPLTINSTIRIRAVAVAPDAAPGTVFCAGYVRLDPQLAEFSSDLPIVVLEDFGDGRPPRSGFVEGVLSIYEQDPSSGRTQAVGPPVLENRVSLRVRGSSTASRDKASYAVEAWDERQQPLDIAPLGMPPESDLVLYAAYNFDRALIRNTFAYELSNQIGRYAPRTRFVELFFNMDGGDLSQQDYRGVYVLMEKIKVDPNRVDIEPLEPFHEMEPDVSGGWLLKIDRNDLGDRGFMAAGGTVQFVDPNERNVTPAQFAWISDHFNRMFESLTDTNPDTGYAQFIDVDSWIDHHLLRILSKEPDSLVLSTFFYKDRDGKITYGPVWDFDRSMGNNDDDRALHPEDWGANFFTFTWWQQLFADPNFKQRWTDRWFELRRGAFSLENLASIIDRQAAEIAEAQVRNQQRWPEVPPDGGQFAPGMMNWEGEIVHLKGWLAARLAWIDSQLIAPPTIDPAGGPAEVGREVTITADRGVVYFRTDGLDPRAPDGSVDPAARRYGEPPFDPIVVAGPMVVKARALTDDGWSALATAELTAIGGPMDLSSLRITEFDYHPRSPSAAELAIGPDWTDDDFEFIEWTNLGGHAIDLSGVTVVDGIEFQFPDQAGRLLQPGESIVVVRNPEAFHARYGSDLPVAGRFTSGGLRNSGERVAVHDPRDVLIEEFTYGTQDPWPESADGSGPSLHRIAPGAPGGDAASWRGLNATPGRTDLPIVGDLDGDGEVSTDDLTRFAMVLSDPSAYEAVYGLESLLTADADLDGDVDFDDIDEFVRLLGR